jgi:hypothetical protein
MNIKKVEFKVIPHSEHRYETVGDYWFDESGTLQVRVSEMSDNRYELLVFLHEMIEVIQTEHRGITEKQIMDFDLEFELERVDGKWTQDDEPGWDPRAPYGMEHAYAESMERNMAIQLGVDWRTYDLEVKNL